MTKLTGRHMEFELFTLSFDEYLGMKGFLSKRCSRQAPGHALRIRRREPPVVVGCLER